MASWLFFTRRDLVNTVACHRTAAVSKVSFSYQKTFSHCTHGGHVAKRKIALLHILEAHALENNFYAHFLCCKFRP
jgi:hypothetical protein